MHDQFTTAPKGGGIYAITHTASGRQYIGSAKRFDRRWSVHLQLLKAGKHYNPRLGHAWHAYGADAFTFTVLETVNDPKQLLIREQHYIDTLHPYYNIAPTAGSMLGYTFTAESKAKIAAALLGRPVGPFTDLHRQRISAGRKGIGLGVPSGRKGWKNTYMTQDEFIAAYPLMTSTEIAAYCHVSQAAVTKWAKALGLPSRYRAGGTGLLKPRTPLAAGAWGPGREECVECATTTLAHKAFGLCTYCYRRRRTLRDKPDSREFGSYELRGERGS